MKNDKDMLLVKVMVSNMEGNMLKRYVMDHNDPAQRKVLGMQCRAAFEAGQSIYTKPLKG